jgi:hypothetical protein
MCDCQEQWWGLVERGLVCRGCGSSVGTSDPIWATLRRLAQEELDAQPPRAEPGGSAEPPTTPGP